MPCPRLSLLLVLFLFPLSASIAEDKDRLVRTSEPLAPEAQQKVFHLPEGFRIQLFADDAQVGGKPINMAFDARGRLWVSSTQEYPYAVPKERWSDPQGTRAKDSKDTIRILEDTDGDGRADKVTIFADEMNIPTGVLPYGNGCIAFSIPNLWYLQDTDGDGRCDQRKILFGPLGWERDTHGMVSSLRLGLDGWVYATHGFSNTSHFEVLPQNRRTADRADIADSHETASKAGQKPSVLSAKSAVKEAGLTLDITSGSVFRFFPDGSRVEPWTTGQVNPFGLCWDSFGNLYSADCHSNPITQLIRGAHYPSFGKPHDGLGFAPVMCTHAHGSTGICGVVYLDGGVWGPEWDDHMLVGNCVTSRVNHDHITFTGATPKANEAPDFITCDDPWFRPVDLQLGPDGALYVADFYNSIIGHYEVPLDHPKRDRKRGRVWRVVREGFTGKLTECDMTKRSPEELIKAFDSNNLTQRLLAVTAFRRLSTGQVWEKVEESLVKGCATPRQKGMGMWVTRSNLADDPHEMTDVHLMLMWAETEGIADKWRLVGLLHHLMGEEKETQVPRTQAAACRASVQFGENAETVAVMLAYLHATTKEADATLRHEALVALRRMADIPEKFSLVAEAMSNPFIVPTAPDAKESDAPEENRALARKLKEAFAKVLRSIPTEKSASWLLKEFANVATTPALRAQTLTHIARHLPAERDGELVALVRQHFGDDLDAQLDLFAAIREGRESQKQSISASRPLATWSGELTKRVFAALRSEPSNPWQPATPPTDANPNPWRPITRRCADGKERAFLDSHVAPGSEKHAATLRSHPFDLGPRITFWIAGHRGFPTAEPHVKNYVRLVDHWTGQELARAYPPRHDVATQVTWTFSEAHLHKKALVHFEIVDGDTATAYAWLAIGGFDPGIVPIPADPQQRDKRIRMLALLSTGILPGTDKSPDGSSASALLTNLRDKSSYTPDTRAALAEFLAANSSDPTGPLFVPLSRDAELAPAVFEILQNPKSPADELAKALRTLPFRAQAKLSAALAGSVDGANHLLKLAPPAVLAEPLVSTKLKALKNAEIDARLKSLTAALPPQNEVLSKLVAQHTKSFDPAKADAKRGEEVFTALCSICHRIGIRGNLVGPQLDGIGARGTERLLEDILDPNRAVDPAFRLHLVKRKDGSLYAGLLRREEGDARIFADATAQETRIPKAEIASDEESPLSLMPPGMGDALKEQQVHDLLAYLLARKP